MPIVPRKLLDMPPEEVLKYHPSLELDVYVFEKILQGPFDIVEETKSLALLPSFSRKFADCYPLLIMAIMAAEKLEISADEGVFAEAVRAGQMVRKNEIRCWRIKDGAISGYGRTFPEALCKYMVAKTFGIKDKKDAES